MGMEVHSGLHNDLLDSSSISGGHDEEFERPLEQGRHECPICLLGLREPVQTICGHRFCEGCILRSLREAGPKCPVDGQPLSKSQLYRDNFAKREIMDQDVFCRMKKYGCTWKGKLGKLEEHLSDCDFVHVKCPKMCGSKGANGLDGPKGVRGPQGPPGPIVTVPPDGGPGPDEGGPDPISMASEGPPGSRGPPGLGGPEGELGAPGAIGRPGTTGQPGQAGPPGSPGEPGMNGADLQRLEDGRTEVCRKCPYNLLVGCTFEGRPADVEAHVKEVVGHKKDMASNIEKIVVTG